MKKYIIWTKHISTEYRKGYANAKSKKEIRDRFKNDCNTFDLTAGGTDTVEVDERIHTIEEVKAEGGEK